MRERLQSRFRSREAAMPFIMLTVLIDMVAIGLIIPVTPELVGSFASSQAEQARWYHTELVRDVVRMLSLGLMQWLQTDAGARSAQWMGGSWQVCSVSIVSLSLPVLGALLWALRQLAPTRPALTGAVAGMLAGSLAASIYSLHCPETSLTFFAVWYAGGIALMSVVGAVLGMRVLRW